MDPNPYESPLSPPKAAPTSTPSVEDSPADDSMRAIGRVGVGCLGGFFAGLPFCVNVAWMIGEWDVVEFLWLPSWICLSIIAVCTAYSRYTPVRVVTWAMAGCGAGNLLEALLAGGLEVGTWLTFSGIVLGGLFAILGYRRRPRCNTFAPKYALPTESGPHQ